MFAERDVESNAGHPPPLLLSEDGTVTHLGSPEGSPPLGVAQPVRGQSAATFGAGDAIVAYTDGLIERRGEDITDGLERLAQAVVRMADEDLPTTMAAIIESVGEPSRDDHVAVLVARRRST